MCLTLNFVAFFIRGIWLLRFLLELLNLCYQQAHIHSLYGKTLQNQNILKVKAILLAVDGLTKQPAERLATMAAGGSLDELPGEGGPGTRRPTGTVHIYCVPR